MRRRLFAVGLGVIFVLAMCQANPAWAEESPTAKRELIRQMVELLKFKENMSQMSKAVFEAQAVSLQSMMTSQSGASQAEKELMVRKMDRVGGRFVEFVSQKIDWDTVIQEVYYPIYEKHFTESELRDLVNFYGSTTGQKFMKTTPLIIQESFERSRQLLLPQVEQLVKEFVKENPDLIAPGGGASPEAVEKDWGNIKKKYPDYFKNGS